MFDLCSLYPSGESSEDEEQTDVSNLCFQGPPESLLNPVTTSLLLSMEGGAGGLQTPDGPPDGSSGRFTGSSTRAAAGDWSSIHVRR